MLAVEADQAEQRWKAITACEVCSRCDCASALRGSARRELRTALRKSRWFRGHRLSCPPLASSRRDRSFAALLDSASRARSRDNRLGFAESARDVFRPSISAADATTRIGALPASRKHKGAKPEAQSR